MRKKSRDRVKRPQFKGWLTSDADEIERRRQRGREEPIRVDPQGDSDDFFGTFQAHPNDGRPYRVEIRSLASPINSCDCPDHRINGLGTCKHIEATLFYLQNGRKRRFQEAARSGSPRIEVFLDRRNHQVRVHWPRGGRQRSTARDLISPFFNDQRALSGDPLDTLPAMERAVAAAPARVRQRIRISNELNPWLEMLDRRAQQLRARQHFEAEVAAGRQSLDLVKVPLYPYQQEGMLHLAFTGRALLADEMGLGKTVQAVAACELLRRTRGIRRVLVISPASLKGEWEEQIGKFTPLSSLIVQGTRARRLAQYEEPAFFNLANYEQIRPDIEEINGILNPDVIILDEAQRIKNWQTKTARAVKRLNSPYAFVLTGTPVENRIDEIYSITQFLDPYLFGPLFRFNRDFYRLDEKGRAVGYKNLRRLHERLRPIMLRRRKDEVEGQLPGRTVNTYFVAMHKEQRVRYGEYEHRVARLAALAKKRPLKKEEMEQLQQYLACMRMLCDTTYILDQSSRISPKLKELDNILRELSEDGDHKIIVFSEWQRMLELVRDQAESKGLGCAWHTGQVPQPRRRAEIRRFKDDPECRLFLSTDSGAVGLNLQVADVVINLDLPWNPAKLEQRIARAWRKHQKRPVQVINLVAQHSIEHRMLSLLEQKRSMAKGVLDGKGASEMALPSGRAAFLERLDSLLAPEAVTESMPSVDPLERLTEQTLARWSDRLDLIELHGEDGQQTLVVVADRVDEGLQRGLLQQLQEQFPEQTPQLSLLDRETSTAIRQLIETGVLIANRETARTLYQAPAADKTEDKRQARRLAAARDQFAQGEHKQRMARVLADGGFPREAVTPMRDAVERALQALFRWQGQTAATPLPLDLIETTLVNTNLLPGDTLSLVSRLRQEQPVADEAAATKLLAQSNDIVNQTAGILERAERS